MFSVVWRVTSIENAIMDIGNSVNAIQPVPDRPIVAIKPTRVLWAMDMINSSIGHANKKPIPVAIADIFPTIVCICRTTKLSDAPIWLRISNSRLCNIAVLRAIYDIHVPMAPNIMANISVAIKIICVPAAVDDCRADACGKKRAVLEICFSKSRMPSVDLNFISHMVGR